MTKVTGIIPYEHGTIEVEVEWKGFKFTDKEVFFMTEMYCCWAVEENGILVQKSDIFLFADCAYYFPGKYEKLFIVEETGEFYPLHINCGNTMNLYKHLKYCKRLLGLASFSCEKYFNMTQSEVEEIDITNCTIYYKIPDWMKIVKYNKLPHKKN